MHQTIWYLIYLRVITVVWVMMWYFLCDLMVLGCRQKTMQWKIIWLPTTPHIRISQHINSNLMRWNWVLTMSVSLRHLILNITNGRSGFLQNCMNMVWCTKKNSLSIEIPSIRPYSPMIKYSPMVLQRDLVQSSSKNCMSNGSSRLLIMRKSYWIILDVIDQLRLSLIKKTG